MDTANLLVDAALEKRVRAALELDFESVVRISIMAGDTSLVFRINEEGRVETTVRGDRYVFVGKEVVLLPKEVVKPAVGTKPPPQVLGAKGIEPAKQGPKEVSTQWMPTHFYSTFAGFSNPALQAPPASSSWSVTPFSAQSP